MPPAIAAVAAVGAAGVGAELIGGAILTSLTYAATSYALNKAAALLTKKGKSGAGSGLEASFIDSSAAGHIVYGRVRKGGVNVLPPLTSGNEGRYLHQTLALAIHECDAMESFTLDTDEILSAQITAITASANDGLVTGSSKYVGEAWLRCYLGTTTQNVDFILNAAFPTNIASTWRGRGITYCSSTFDWGKGKTYTGGVPNTAVKLRGKKCYDPRLDITPGASPTNPAYIAWTVCPALCWADYKMSQTYGQKCASTDIDWDSVVAAANICDALVAIPGASTQARYTFNGVLMADADTEYNERAFIDAMLGKLAFTGGKWRIFAGAWRAPVYEIDKEDWVQINAIQTTAPRGSDRYNGVVTYFVDKDRNWQRMESFRRYNDTYKSADGAERVWVELEQPNCTQKYEAERKGEMLLRQSRNGIKLTGILPPRFMRLRTWDNVTLYFDEMGWSGKTFTVASCALRPDGSIQVSLSEEQDTDWTDMVGSDYGAPSITDIPSTNPTNPSVPSSFAVTPLLGTLRFDLGEPLVRPYNTRYQILRSPGTLAVAGSYSVLWEGDVTQITLPADVRSLYWYHGRMVANSYYSDLSPSTFGIASAPYIPPESVPGNRGFPDGELYFASASYWAEGGTGFTSFCSYQLLTTSGVTPQRGRVSISTNSGTAGGAQIEFSPVRYDINSRMYFRGVPMLPYQNGIAYITARRTTSHGPPNLAWKGYAVQVTSPKSFVNSSLLFNSALSTSVAAASSGDWLTFIQTFTMPGSRYDHFVPVLDLFNIQGLSFIEIGAMQVSIL